MTDNNNEKIELEEDEMYIELNLGDGQNVNCAIVAIFSLLEQEEQQYIALLPLDESNQSYDDGEVWIYGYSENPDDPDEEPILRNITDDEEYEKAADAFDEYLDSCEFDEIIEEDQE